MNHARPRTRQSGRSARIGRHASELRSGRRRLRGCRAACSIADLPTYATGAGSASAAPPPRDRKSRSCWRGAEGWAGWGNSSRTTLWPRLSSCAIRRLGESWEEVAHPYPAAYARLWMAEAAALRGEGSAARRELAAALDVAGGRGAGFLIRERERLRSALDLA